MLELLGMTVALKEIASFGLGGSLCILFFLVYRRDRKQSEDRLREDRKFMEDRLTIVIAGDQKSREKNTKALTGLVTLLRALNGKLSKVRKQP